ncbi:DNA-directed RNA polymerase III subunit like [Actinidia chinensis var. chinensis]|uniref:DNA-directed RNA polymerase III subunit RPC3 n=1 Tax=Actinidia chinensis var. chinensis TaxID=1590841 RepID=A0A2R6RQU6_ACTCC|nr:DNA-directed RNA polymerase III subunit like [Actinidia chinensis var. chinensis]
MASQYGIKLAVYLVSSYFGDLVAKVCECLLRRGTLPWRSIVQFTELNPTQVKNSLLVLIQHNCVQAFAMEQEGVFGEAPKVVTQYMALFDNIIHHMRFPKFLAIVSEELGKECEEILEGLLQHGRLSLNQILDRHKETSNQSGGNCTAQDALQKNFSRLLCVRYVERCPAHEPFIAPPNEEGAAVKKRGAKSAKVTEELQTIEQRALAAAAPMEALRFLFETYTETDDHELESEENLSNMEVGQKRKHVDSEAGTNKRKKEVLWRANFEQFVRRLRHKACIENARTRLDDGAAIVLSAILEASRSSETKVKVESSIPLSMNTIFEEVMKSEDGRIMTLEHVRTALAQLAAISIDETYSVDLKSIIELAQNEEVESIVLKRYGREAYRMFRLLSKAGHLLETDKISDTTFVEKKETAKILFKLWKDDYLHMEKIVASAGRQSQFLLWKVNKHSLWGHVLDEMYHAALNLRIRNAHEQEQEKEILQIPREKLVGDLEKRSKRLRKVRIVLESSLMRLDEAIMIFHDF